MHKKTVEMFPGNSIPIFRGNQNAKRRLDELADTCKEHINPDIGYDEGNMIVNTCQCIFAKICSLRHKIIRKPNVLTHYCKIFKNPG